MKSCTHTHKTAQPASPRSIKSLEKRELIRCRSPQRDGQEDRWTVGKKRSPGEIMHDNNQNCRFTKNKHFLCVFVCAHVWDCARWLLFRHLLLLINLSSLWWKHQSCKINRILLIFCHVLLTHHNVHEAALTPQSSKSHNNDENVSLSSFLHSDQVLHPVIWRPVLLGLPNHERVPHCPHRHGVQSLWDGRHPALQRPGSQEGLHLSCSGQRQGGAQVNVSWFKRDLVG